MSAARRTRRRQDWPRGLYEPRPGYYVYRHPDGRTFTLGAIPLTHARQQVLQANAHLMAAEPSLVDRLTGTSHSVADLLDKMPVSPVMNTMRANKSQDNAIRAALGSKPCGGLSVADCSAMLEAIEKAGKKRRAQSIRSRLIAVCRKGMQLGWMESNPAEVTSEVAVVVKRGRLTLESYRAIYAKAGEVAEWLPHAMNLALVTGADRSSIVGMQRANVANGLLTFQRGKTGVRIAIPLRLRLDAADLTLEDLCKSKTGVVSRYLVHHVNTWNRAPAGSPVHPDTLSNAFTEARKLAKIPDGGHPTFHEIRSLCKRLYKAQGNVDTKALLGHKTEAMGALYEDPRGAEPIMVRVG